MGALAGVLAGVLAVSFVVFVALFGRLPAFRHTPIAWLHRLCVVQLPHGILAADQVLTDGRLSTSLQRFGRFLVHDQHPTVLVFFVVLLAVSEYLAIPTAWPLLTAVQRCCLAVLVVLPYGFLYRAAFSDPGTVALANLPHHLAQYPYDYALFFPGARCRTCNLLKPPRSKHCSVCKRCIGRLDHHCIFINNCVGAGNHHWFLLLLAATAALATYGGVVATSLVAARTRQIYPTWSVWPWRARAVGDPGLPMALQDWLVIWTWGMRDVVRLACVGLLGLLLCPLVWGLAAYNLWNIYCGQTTSESLKWSDWKSDMADGLVFRRRLSRERGPGATAAQTPGPTPLTRWPIEPEHVLVFTGDGQPPSADDPHLPGVGDWEQVWHLRDVENIYDLGFWNNLLDVFVPGCRFHTQGLPSVEVRGRARSRAARK